VRNPYSTYRGATFLLELTPKSPVPIHSEYRDVTGTPDKDLQHHLTHGGVSEQRSAPGDVHPGR
jgi:hypothetical protein